MEEEVDFGSSSRLTGGAGAGMGFEMDSHGDVQNAKSKRIVPSAANKDLYLCIETGAKIPDDMMAVPEHQGSVATRQQQWPVTEEKGV